jgi:MFS family permease
VYLSLRNRPSGGGTRGSISTVSGTTVLLGFTSLFTDISSEMLAAILPLYLTTIVGLSPAAFGVVDGLYHGVSAVTRLASGYLSDRFGRPKAVAVVGYGLSTVTRPFFLFVQSMAGVSALVSLDRMGKGVRTAPRDAMIAASAPREQLGLNFGVHRSLDNFGAMLGPLLAFALLAWHPRDFDSVFVTSMAAAVIGLAILVLLVPGRPSSAEGPGGTVAVARPARLTSADVAALVRMRPFVRLVAIVGLLGVFVISDAFLYLALLERNDALARVFPLLPVATALVYVLLSVPLGRGADAWGRVPVYMAGYVLLVGAYAASQLAPAGAVSALLTVCLLGAFYAATDGVVTAAVAAMVPAPVRASAIAALQTVTALAALVSSVAFGFLVTYLTWGTAVLVMTVGVVVAVAVGSGILLSRQGALS